MGQSPPPLDSSQDYNLTMATEEEGHTILHIERAGNTGDTKDIQFTVSSNIFFSDWILSLDFHVRLILNNVAITKTNFKSNLIGVS